MADDLSDQGQRHARHHQQADVAVAQVVRGGVRDARDLRRAEHRAAEPGRRERGVDDRRERCACVCGRHRLQERQGLRHEGHPPPGRARLGPAHTQTRAAHVDVRPPQALELAHAQAGLLEQVHHRVPLGGHRAAQGEEVGLRGGLRDLTHGARHAHRAVPGRVRAVEVGEVEHLLDDARVHRDRLRRQLTLRVHPRLHVPGTDLAHLHAPERPQPAHGLAVVRVSRRAHVDARVRELLAHLGERACARLRLCRDVRECAHVRHAHVRKLPRYPVTARTRFAQRAERAAVHCARLAAADAVLDVVAHPCARGAPLDPDARHEKSEARGACARRSTRAHAS
ncbi:MAG TPA: hypothetical protein VNU01_03360 [Egibacteraceae bacterium]|nr:hypothetical protein [Egibacteraceae bacterium]